MNDLDATATAVKGTLLQEEHEMNGGGPPARHRSLMHLPSMESIDSVDSLVIVGDDTASSFPISFRRRTDRSDCDGDKNPKESFDIKGAERSRLIHGNIVAQSAAVTLVPLEAPVDGARQARSFKRSPSPQTHLLSSVIETDPLDDARGRSRNRRINAVRHSSTVSAKRYTGTFPDDVMRRAESVRSFHSTFALTFQ
jgi:hypothetical protein